MNGGNVRSRRLCDDAVGRDGSLVEARGLGDGGDAEQLAPGQGEGVAGLARLLVLEPVARGHEHAFIGLARLVEQALDAGVDRRKLHRLAVGQKPPPRPFEVRAPDHRVEIAGDAPGRANHGALVGFCPGEQRLHRGGVVGGRKTRVVADAGVKSIARAHESILPRAADSG